MGGRGNSGNARKKTLFLQESVPYMVKSCLVGKAREVFRTKRRSRKLSAEPVVGEFHSDETETMVVRSEKAGKLKPLSRANLW